MDNSDMNEFQCGQFHYNHHFPKNAIYYFLSTFIAVFYTFFWGKMGGWANIYPGKLYTGIFPKLYTLPYFPTKTHISSTTTKKGKVDY